ncbi:MAG TPA: hypothetical protein VFW53_09385 [Gallionella sp.]|nr:hypothetical protein [Gallionella sp.]
MEQQQQFSPGLLYSVAPENFSELHLQDEARVDGFEWDEDESPFANSPFAQAVLSFLKTTAAKWGLAGHY